MNNLKFTEYLFLFCTLAIGFLAVTFFVVNGAFLPADRAIDQSFAISTDSILYYASAILAYIFVPTVIIIITLFVRFIRKKQFYEAKLLLASFSGFVMAELVLKPIFKIPCPATYYSNVLSGQGILKLVPFLQNLALRETCYPSGHVAAYVVFCGYLSYLVLLYVRNQKLRWALLATLIAIIILVGPSRIYLHIHWFSDVIASYFLGFALLIGIIIIRYRHDVLLWRIKTKKEHQLQDSNC